MLQGVQKVTEGLKIFVILPWMIIFFSISDILQIIFWKLIMDKYSIEQRMQFVKLFYQNQGSIVLTQRAYRQHFHVRDSPSHKPQVNKPQTLQELKENIRNEIRELNRNPEILQSAMNNVLERAQICEAENGQHLKDIIFHK